MALGDGEFTIRASDGSTLKLTEIVATRCPDCPGTFSVSEDEQHRPMVLHTMPYCRGFDAANTLEEVLAYAQRGVDQELARRGSN